MKEKLANEVAIERGPNPKTQFEVRILASTKMWDADSKQSMPIYVRLGMHLLYIGKRQRKLLGHSKINEMLKNQSIMMGKKYDSEENPLEHILEFIDTYEIALGDLLYDPSSHRSKNGLTCE